MGKDSRTGLGFDALQFVEVTKRGRKRTILIIDGNMADEAPAVLLLLQEMLKYRGLVLRREYLIEVLEISGKKKNHTLNVYMHRLRRMFRTYGVQAEIAIAAEVGYALCTFAK